MNRKSSINLKECIGYGLGDAASSMFWKLFGSYLLIFYTDIFGLEAAAVGTMFLVTRIWDSFFDPIVGIVADRTRTQWGKFRPYLLFLAIPIAIIGIFTFYTPPLSPPAKLLYAYITYSLMMMVYSAINVPYASLLGVMSPYPADRNNLSTYRMAFAYLGSFLALLLFIPLVNYFSKNSKLIIDQQYGWVAAVAVIAVLSSMLFLGCFKLTRERVKPKGNDHSSLKKDLRDLSHNKPWWILLGAGICTLIFNSIRDGATVYYFKYYVNEEQLGAVHVFNIPFILSGLYLAVGQLSNIIGVMLAAPVSNRIGKKNTYMLVMAIATVFSVLFFWLERGDLWVIFFLQIVISICAGCVFPLLWSMYADCADYSEWKTGHRATGLIFSSSSMSQKIGWAIGSALTGWLLTYFGFQANQVQNAETIRGIKLFLSFLPAAGAFLSIFLIYYYPLTKGKLLQITAELEIKRNQ
ncbi:MFS transporter [Olivibacter sp. XZL3]|uniref:MFS transporter n=1 Tax=Olivibacter sp. XZL3 TaxID=1735116 RepID=UPI00106513A3|nr:MFS transporter [Olivibacter sp. XZL3]